MHGPRCAQPCREASLLEVPLNHRLSDFRITGSIRVVRVPWAMSDAPWWLPVIVLLLTAAITLPYWIAVLRDRARRQREPEDPKGIEREP